MNCLVWIESSGIKVVGGVSFHICEPHSYAYVIRGPLDTDSNVKWDFIFQLLLILTIFRFLDLNRVEVHRREVYWRDPNHILYQVSWRYPVRWLVTSCRVQEVWARYDWQERTTAEDLCWWKSCCLSFIRLTVLSSRESNSWLLFSHFY